LHIRRTNDTVLHNHVPKVAAWRSGNGVWRINEVTLRQTPLVLGWVTVFGGQTTSVFYQASQANSASYSQRDGKWVPAKSVVAFTYILFCISNVPFM